MWQAIDPAIFGTLNPVDTYIYYDGPLAFSAQHEGRWFYVHEQNQEAEYTSYFVRETSQSELAELNDNKIELKTFLKEAPTLYVVRYFGDNKPLEAYIVNPADFSDANFPTAGCYLHHEQKQDQLPE